MKCVSDAVRLAATTFSLPLATAADPELRVRNEELQQNLQTIITRRNELSRSVTLADKDLVARQSDLADLGDQILNMARIVRLQVKVRRQAV